MCACVPSNIFSETLKPHSVHERYAMRDTHTHTYNTNLVCRYVLCCIYWRRVFRKYIFVYVGIFGQSNLNNIKANCVVRFNVTVIVLYRIYIIRKHKCAVVQIAYSTLIFVYFIDMYKSRE